MRRKLASAKDCPSRHFPINLVGLVNDSAERLAEMRRLVEWIRIVSLTSDEEANER